MSRGRVYDEMKFEDGFVVSDDSRRVEPHSWRYDSSASQKTHEIFAFHHTNIFLLHHHFALMLLGAGRATGVN